MWILKLWYSCSLVINYALSLWPYRITRCGYNVYWILGWLCSIPSPVWPKSSHGRFCCALPLLFVEFEKGENPSFAVGTYEHIYFSLLMAIDVVFLYCLECCRGHPWFGRGHASRDTSIYTQIFWPRWWTLLIFYFPPFQFEDKEESVGSN